MDCQGGIALSNLLLINQIEIPLLRSVSTSLRQVTSEFSVEIPLSPVLGWAD